MTNSMCIQVHSYWIMLMKRHDRINDQLSPSVKDKFTEITLLIFPVNSYVIVLVGPAHVSNWGEE